MMCRACHVAAAAAVLPEHSVFLLLLRVALVCLFFGGGLICLSLLWRGDSGGWDVLMGRVFMSALVVVGMFAACAATLAI